MAVKTDIYNYLASGFRSKLATGFNRESCGKAVLPMQMLRQVGIEWAITNQSKELKAAGVSGVCILFPWGKLIILRGHCQKQLF